MVISYGSNHQRTTGLSNLISSFDATTTFTDVVSNQSLEDIEKCCVYEAKNYLQFNSWEANLMGSQNSGGGNFLYEKMNYYKLVLFANKLLSGMENSPLEFEQTFKENFWNLLA